MRKNEILRCVKYYSLHILYTYFSSKVWCLEKTLTSKAWPKSWYDISWIVCFEGNLSCLEVVWIYMNINTHFESNNHSFLSVKKMIELCQFLNHSTLHSCPRCSKKIFHSWCNFILFYAEKARVYACTHSWDPNLTH